MHKAFSIFLGFILLVSIESCGKRPFACFETSVDEADIHVNQPVKFFALCSSNADDFYWEFYDNEDSTEFGYSVTKTFKDTGLVNVFLLVSKGNKTSSTERKIKVLP